MDKSTQELLDKLRFTYADNGSGYNSDFTLTLQQAADLIDELTKKLNKSLPIEQPTENTNKPYQYLVRGYNFLTCQWSYWEEIPEETYYKLEQKINEGNTWFKVKKII